MYIVRSTALAELMCRKGHMPPKITSSCTKRFNQRALVLTRERNVLKKTPDFVETESLMPKMDITNMYLSKKEIRYQVYKIVIMPLAEHGISFTGGK